jgi:hypothetical protein
MFGAYGGGGGGQVGMGAMGVGGMGLVQGLGWFTPMAKVYMNDVIDHLEVSFVDGEWVVKAKVKAATDKKMVVSSSEQFAGTCDHLTDYCFVRMSMRSSDRRLLACLLAACLRGC